MCISQAETCLMCLDVDLGKGKSADVCNPILAIVKIPSYIIDIHKIWKTWGSYISSNLNVNQFYSQLSVDKKRKYQSKVHFTFIYAPVFNKTTKPYAAFICWPPSDKKKIPSPRLA